MGQVLGFAGYLLAYVALPGWCAWRWLRRADDDGVTAVCVSFALGVAIESLVYMGAKLSGAELVFQGSPLVFLVLACLVRPARDRRSESSASPRPRLSRGEQVVLVLLLAVALVRSTMIERGA